MHHIKRQIKYSYLNSLFKKKSLQTIRNEVEKMPQA